MERLLVTGGARLEGAVVVSGAKNSALKLMAAALLAPGRTVLRNVPRIQDCFTMGEVLEHLGAGVAWDGNTVTIDATTLTSVEAPYELVRRMRASTAVLGSLLARAGRARVAMPGGDEIGSRPIDLHIAGLRSMGAQVGSEHGFLVAETAGLRGAAITLDYPSVGATENLMMAAVRARGTTVIDNAAREPEIADIAAFLVAMGARIEGAGTNTIEIDGVDELTGTEHVTIPDRIEAGTWAAAAVATGGDLLLEHARADHLDLFLHQARRCGRPHRSHRGRHPRAAGRTRAGHRLRDLALPGRGHRLPADPDGDARHRRRHQHRHRERVREPVPLRGRTAAHGRRHPDRRSSRGDPGRSPAVGGPGARASTSARAPPW